MSSTPSQHPASFRDPSGFVFEQDGIIYRQVNLLHKEHFDHFIKSGCYDYFSNKGWLIPHEEASIAGANGKHSYKIIRPEKLRVVSYPSEWSFDMLKDAALLTLQITRQALDFGMILKDASPLNIQWHKGRLIFIDTLSFEKYEEYPWIAYRQFCESFLGPLLIMHYNRSHLPQLFAAWPEGMPIQLIHSLLPFTSRFSLPVYLHIHLNAKYADRKMINPGLAPKFSKTKLLRLLESLETLISRLKTPAADTNWSGYYREAGERNDYLLQKKRIIKEWIDQSPHISTATDLGANQGEFSELMAKRNIYTLSADLDAQSINQLYGKIKTLNLENIQPLVTDLSNPAPAGGLNNAERSSFIQRTKSDLVLALALIHHLSIGKNIPFIASAQFFSSIGDHLIIEFVPKEDDKVKLMLGQKKDIYSDYHETTFAATYLSLFSLIDKKIIPGTQRVLYFLKKK